MESCIRLVLRSNHKSHRQGNKHVRSVIGKSNFGNKSALFTSGPMAFGQLKTSVLKRREENIMSKFHLRLAGYWLIAFGILLMAPMSAWAQTSVSATISGVITDPSGAVIPDVSITAINTGTQQTARTSTNPSGNFVLPNLPSGNYNVKAEKEGFQVCENLGVHLDPASSVQVNCTM